MRRGSIVALLGIGLVAGGVATAVALIPTWLPVDASREAGRIDFTFWFVIAICIALFAVVAAAPLAQQPAVLTRLGSDSFTLQAPRAGTYTVRVRFTPYWKLAPGPGCVRRGNGDWTQLQLPRGGSFHVVIGFSLGRIFGHGPRCD